MDIDPQISEKLKNCEMPHFPEVTEKIIRLTREVYADPADVAELVKVDMSLTAAVLRVANSVAFGYAGKVASICDAINRLGMARVRDMVLSVSLFKEFEDLKGIDFPKLWNHCLSVGLAADIIAKKASNKVVEDPANLYTAGLLHKAGIILLAQNFAEDYQKVLEEVAVQERDLWELEKEIIGVTHNEASHFVFENWKFPREVSNAALYYNNPADAPDDLKGVVYIIHLANFACLNQGIGVGIDRFPNSFFDEAWDFVGLSVDDIPELLDKMEEMKSKSQEILKAAR